jgi:hypothetical protein
MAKIKARSKVGVVAGPVDEKALGLEPMTGGRHLEEVPDRGPRQVVVHKEDTQREPTEEEILAKEPIHQDAAVESVSSEARCRAMLTAIADYRSGEVRWKALTPFQRYFIEGVRTMCMEALGEKDEAGRTVTVVRQLGIDLRTGKPAGR